MPKKKKKSCVCVQHQKDAFFFYLLVSITLIKIHYFEIGLFSFKTIYAPMQSVHMQHQANGAVVLVWIDVSDCKKL